MKVCNAGALSYMKVLKLIMSSRGRIRHADSLAALLTLRKTKVAVLVHKAMRERNELLVAQYRNPLETLKDLRSMYLQNNDRIKEVTDYLKENSAKDQFERDEKWNRVVAFVLGRSIVKVAARPGNIANLTVANISKAQKIEEHWAVFNPKHKVSEKSPCFVFFDEDEFKNMILPLSTIAK